MRRARTAERRVNAARGLAIVVATMATGCGHADWERNAATREGLKGAALAPEAEQVVAIVNFAGGQCSGVPIAPNLVLTARHCVGATSETSDRVDCEQTTFVDPDSAGAMFVLSTSTITDDPDDYHPVERYRVLAGDDPAVCGRDIALLRLERRLTSAPLVPRLESPALAGESYTAYGFGDDDGAEGAGIRRQLSGQVVRCVGEDCRDADVRATEWLGSDGVCSGDSGGPALDEQGRVLGVASRGFSGCRSPIYTSVFTFAEFLIAEARLAAREGGYATPEWAREASESDHDAPESSCAFGPARGPERTRGLLATGLLLALWGVRRRTGQPFAGSWT